ncbi:hypothetical protein [Devosia sp.]|uniref:hypothetical protein n=1 Tax=Devosia sp. TaxID=1871048 RepID=UPI002FC6B62D
MRPALVVLLLVACAPAGAAEISRCVLQVGGVTYIDGPCDYSAFNGANFQISGKDYFAYVYPSNEPVMGYWNGDPQATHAHDPLGELHRDGACWLNDQAKVCAYR